LSICSIASEQKLNRRSVERYYKEHLSDFVKWQKETDLDALVYPQNLGERLCIDEVLVGKGDLYTVVTNPEGVGKKGSLVAIIKGTKSKVVTEALYQIPLAKRLQVKSITLDFANSMDWIARLSFPNARRIGDRFHAQKLVNEALQSVRVTYRWQALAEEDKERLENGDTRRQLLARSRHLLMQPQGSWTDSQRERAMVLFKHYPEVKRAYNLATSFRAIYRHKNMTRAKTALANWINDAAGSKLESFFQIAKSVEYHQSKILGYFYNRETNAFAEGFNSKIKELKRTMRGLRNLDFFFYRLEKLYA